MKIAFPLSQHKNVRILLAAIVCVYIINSIYYLNAQSITSDEGSFINYAIRFAKGHPERLIADMDNSKMPVSVLNIIPRAIEQFLHPSLQKKDNGFSDIMMGRYVTLFFSMLTLLLVFKWAKELYGNGAALFATFLFSLCPNLLANASLVTTDSYSVLMLLTTMYLFWKWKQNGRLLFFIFFSISIAAAQLTKQSLFHLYILVPLLLFVFQFIQRKKINYKPGFLLLLLFLFINWLILNTGFYFYKTNCTVGSYHFVSSLFQSVQSFLPSNLVIPLPQPFVQGLDMAKHYDEVGGGIDGISSFGKVTILGRESTGGSFWYYYFITFLFKTPLPFLVFFIWRLSAAFRKKANQVISINELYLLLPVLYYIILFSFFYKTQCGIRHLIFVYPMLFIFSASLINSIRNKKQRILLVCLCACLVLSIFYYRGNYFPYTNELVFDKKNAYRIVGAANLEFSQGKFFAKEYLLQHPEVQRAPLNPSRGLFLINTEDYLDVWNRHRYDWLKAYKPVAHVAFNWLLIKAD